MWNERRMTSGPGRRRQARRPALLMRSARIGPVLGAHSCEHRRARRPPASSEPLGASPPFRRGCHPPPEREQESRPGRESRWRATPERTETGRAAPSAGRTTTEIRIVEEHSSQRPILWSGLRPRTGGGTPRAIARIEVRAIGSAMWLVRCRCRHRPLRIRAPALVQSRPSRSRELVPGSSLPVRPSNLAGG
jgi:hypothetical protein